MLSVEFSRLTATRAEPNWLSLRNRGTHLAPAHDPWNDVAGEFAAEESRARQRGFLLRLKEFYEESEMPWESITHGRRSTAQFGSY